MNGWVPVALAADLEPGTSIGTRIEGQEYVVWRDTAGQAHVWEDRCPHRGMRLSFGFVRGDHLACLYHGWQFDGAGQCRLIPAHPEIKVPKTIRTTRFPCVERLGIVWTHASENGESEPGGEPPEDATVTAVRTLTLEVAAQMVHGLLAPDGAGSVIRSTIDDLPILAALQPLSAQQTALHIVIAGQRAPAEQKAAALWAAALRTRIEGGGA